jgi:PadR family transcriptional regulator PadR
MRKSNPSFLNGVPELLVLKLLSRREMYGYEIVRAIETETGKSLSFGEGCIYPYLQYFESEKLVTSRRKTVDGRERTYYQITARGRARFKELSEEWKRVTDGVALLLGGQYA